MASTRAAPPTATRTEDQRVTLNDVTWSDFELILQIRGDRAGVRMTYLNGVLELMTPSVDHEGIKKTISRLLEAYAEEKGMPFNGFGSWTLKNARRARALEPDECYSLSLGRPTSPDLAIEVVWTSGGIDKLDVYRGLGFPGAEDLGNMFQYQAILGNEFLRARDPKLARSLNPELLDFQTWLATSVAKVPVG